MAKTAEKPKKPASNGKSKAAKPTYVDGKPFDHVQFFDAKLILKPDFFATVKGFKAFSELVAEAAAKVQKVKYEAFDLSKARPRIREVMFLDTADFRLYNNAFILRRRTEYQDGFPIADPEVVFKYREHRPARSRPYGRQAEDRRPVPDKVQSRGSPPQERGRRLSHALCA